MAPERWFPGAARACALALVFAFGVAAPADALRIVNYNILNYPGSTGPTRDPHYRTILAPLSPDVVVVQEMQSQAGVDEFLGSVLNTLEPGQWAAAPFINGNDTDNALFYKPAKVQFLGSWAFYPNPAQPLRFAVCYRLKPVGYSDASTELRIYSQHLKASSGSSNEARRAAEATTIRDSMNAMPPGTHAILLGDFNIYTGTEPAFTKLLESQTNNVGRLYDPLNAPLITWNTASLAAIHSQCPCLTCPGGSGFAGGGLDDRFDMFLPTYNMNDGSGPDLIVSSYIPVGNDGLHYNGNITDPPTIPEGAAYANALWNASDHLPIRVDVMLPAKLGAPAALALGTVIVGGGADLAVTNPAPAPADTLDYTLSAPGGFDAPGGTFHLLAGAPPDLRPVATTAGSPGPRAGNLVIASNDPDVPSALVHLTADVLDHAQPSLDSLAAVTADLIDFGEHTTGGFQAMPARVHNRGYSSLQAKLSVESGAITGGAGRFSIAGGFSPALVAGVAATYDVAFDDAGATQDSTYEATLVFGSSDEPLPGATARPGLAVTLRAKPASGTVAVGGGPLAPSATVLYAPFPNPLAGESTVRLDLAERGIARLEVFDLTGRRVATLADRAFEPGRYSVRWNGRDASGSAVGPGIYFLRLAGPGLRARFARLAVVR